MPAVPGLYANFTPHWRIICADRRRGFNQFSELLPNIQAVLRETAVPSIGSEEQGDLANHQGPAKNGSAEHENNGFAPPPLTFSPLTFAESAPAA